MFLKTASNAKHCEQNYIFYLTAGATRATRFFAAEAALLLLNGPTL